MRIATVGMYLCKAFTNGVVLVISAIATFLYNVFFPELSYLYGTLAIFGMMCIDLATRLWAQKRKGKCGWIKAIAIHSINSKSFARGTINKLAVFGVMMIISACAYRLFIIKDVSIWFTQFVFLVLFFTELLSVLENLIDAGCDVGIMKRLVRKKFDECTGIDTANPEKKDDDIL